MKNTVIEKMIELQTAVAELTKAAEISSDRKIGALVKRVDRLVDQAGESTVRMMAKDQGVALAPNANMDEMLKALVPDRARVAAGDDEKDQKDLDRRGSGCGWRGVDDG